LTSFIFCLGGTPLRFGLLAGGAHWVGWWLDAVWFGLSGILLRCDGTLKIGQQTHYDGTGHSIEQSRWDCGQ
jgi:hypothetical protein